MPNLKLFISHSSRLDDVTHPHPSDQANWDLLSAVCEEIRARYSGSIRLLMDRDEGGGLLPSDDWAAQLNLWLAECNAAVILVTKRALERSDWVAKEAAILSWRWALDREFRLILIPIADECGPDDLQSGYFGALGLDRIQCESASRDAKIIVDRIKRCIGDREQLIERETPFTLIQRGIARILEHSSDPQALDAAAAALGCPVPGPRATRAEAVAESLARCLLGSSSGPPHRCFNQFETLLGKLHLGLSREDAHKVLKQVRSLWVHPAAAAYLPLALADQRPIALHGQLLTYVDESLGTNAYTLDRYLERAWPGEPPLCVPIPRVDDQDPIGKIKEEIRFQVFKKRLPPSFPEAEQDKTINERGEPILLLLSTAPETGGYPDPLLWSDLTELPRHYHRLVLVLASQDAAQPPLPDLAQVEPILDQTDERAAYTAELAANGYLQRCYRGC